MTSRCYGDVDKQLVDKVRLNNGHVVCSHVVREECREDWMMTSSSYDTVTPLGGTSLTPAETAVHKLA